MNVDKLNNLAEMIRNSERVVVFTGAGISTSAGLPDFRGSSGLWKNVDPAQLASVEAMENFPEDFREFYRMRIQALGGLIPTKAHNILAEWENRGFLRGIITQNVDGLHRMAGSRNIARIHGTLSEVRCQRCGSVFPASEFSDTSECRKCSGPLRPGVVLFGEMLPVEELRVSQDLSEGCDLFIVLGSSLQVSPANWFPSDAKKSGARLVIVNAESTPFDEMADLVIHDDIDQVLEGVENILTEKNNSMNGGGV